MMWSKQRSSGSHPLQAGVACPVQVGKASVSRGAQASANAAVEAHVVPSFFTDLSRHGENLDRIGRGLLGGCG